jgi:predicted metalloprotease with PDZ domain
MPQARLMDALGLTSGTVSLRLDRLTKAGIVIREPDPDDRRGSLIRLSDNGLQLFDVLAPEHLANEDRLLSALTDEQRATLADLLRHLLVSLEPSRPSPQAHLGLSVESAMTARKHRSAVGLSDTAGLLVTTVDPGSPAGDAGLRRGDLIVDIDGRPARNTAALTEGLASVAVGDSVELLVLRGDEPRSVEVRKP